MRGLVATIVRLRLTIGYAVALIAVTTVLVIEGPRVQNRVIEHASTNLHNLRQGRLGTLIGSAFVTDAGPIYLWLPGLMCLLGLAELQWRSARLALTFVLGHIGATLVVGIGMAAAVWLHWLPVSIARDTDVGMSYGAAAVVGALTASIPRRWRSAWAAGWITISAVSILCNQTFTEVGHMTALLFGMCAGHLLSLGQGRWSTLRLLLLAFGGLFAMMMFAEDEPTLIVAAPAAIAAAVLGAWISSRRPRDQAAIV